MRVTSISVKELFGVFNHEIPLNRAEPITIIHGPNGFGKTVVLRMVAALFKSDPTIFRHIPFTEFSLNFENGTGFTVFRSTKIRKSGKSRVSLQFAIRDSKGNTTPMLPSAEPMDIPPSVLSRIDQQVPAPYGLSGASWVDSAGNRFSLAEIMQRFPKAAAAVPVEFRPPTVFAMFKDLDLFFVETNRLGAESSAPTRLDAQRSLYYVSSIAEERINEAPLPRVKQYSNDVVQRIQSVLASYARYSQEMDRTFPERLVRFVPGQIALNEKEILSRVTELEKKRRRLISLGLLDSEMGLTDLAEEDVRRAREALTIYVDDVQEKLKVFDDIAGRIGILMDIVNDRFKYKRLSLDRERGFRVVTDQKQNVELEDLSSGEQHELIVLYELLFRAPKNALVLVDEPEISLHVAWQSRFLSDLINILGLTDAYAIVATHSPVVIGTRWDLTIELKGPGDSK